MVEKIRKTNSRPWAAVALVVIIVAGVLALTPLGETARQTIGLKTKGEAGLQEFENQFEKNLITYSDELWDFSLKYPLGYKVATDTPLGRVQFSADRPLSSSQIIDVTIVPVLFEDKDFEDMAADAENVTLKKYATVNGRKALLLNYRQVSPFTGELFEMRQAIITGCQTIEEPTDYTAIITGAVPEGMALDTQLADYMISSFRCG